jgi:RNA-directed DNA polymerase
MPINKNPQFNDIFDLYFHNKHQFNDFININIDNNIEQFKFRNKIIFKTKKNSPLKEFHKFITLFILNKLEINKVCFSYSKGLTTEKCLFPHKNSKYFISTDINNFFNSITKKDILNILDKNLENIGIKDLSKYLNIVVNMLTIDDKLSIGFSTSGVISNAVLFEFDNIVTVHCKKKNIIYTRYADDLIFSSNDKSVKTIIPKIDEILSTLFDNRLSRNFKKTKFYSHNSRVEILGFTITPSGNITINKKLKSKIENLMYVYINNNSKFIEILNKEFDGKIEKISGLMAYINSADKLFMQKMKKKYGNFVIDSFLRKSISV